jgi:hypothetical protein
VWGRTEAILRPSQGVHVNGGGVGDGHPQGQLGGRHSARSRSRSRPRSGLRLASLLHRLIRTGSLAGPGSAVSVRSAGTCSAAAGRPADLPPRVRPRPRPVMSPAFNPPALTLAPAPGSRDQASGPQDQRGDLLGAGDLGSTEMYVSAVSTMLEWPSWSCTVRRSTPAASASVAAPCRRSCSRTGGSPAPAASFLKVRLSRSGPSGGR